MSETLVIGIVVFTLATLLGIELIQRVPPTLHTPLMSGSNAISGITIVGAILIAGARLGWFSETLGFAAVVLATLNVVGGYAVTDRMLAMFRKAPGKDAGAAPPGLVPPGVDTPRAGVAGAKETAR